MRRLLFGIALAALLALGVADAQNRNGGGGGGSGTVTTTGSPASGNIAKFSGGTSITNGDLTGDATTSGTTAVTVSKTGGVAFAASATTDTTSASNISSGTLAAARGGAGTITGALKANGSGVVSQAACADLSNGVASCSTDTTNASNISSGTLAAARGGAGTITGALKGNGSGTVNQAACADLSNAVASCSTDATNASNISSGTLAAARGGAGTITGALKANGSGVVTQAACADLSNAATSCSTDATNAANISSGLLAIARTYGVVQPQGRLTLVTATPVMTSDQTAKSQIFYDCYAGKLVPYFDGTNDNLDTIASCEVSLTMQTSGTGVTNNAGVFDIWWVHSGANRVCVATNGSGGGWASDTGGSNTARGTGYSQIHNTRGYGTNVNSITHCYNGTTDYGSISADQATYLGTITTTAAGQTGIAIHPAAASGGANNFLGVWNAYNRVLVIAQNQDNAGTRTSTSSTWAVFGGNSNRISFVDGLAQSHITSTFETLCFTTANAASCGIGVVEDSTSAAPGHTGQAQTDGASNTSSQMSATTTFYPLAGLHFIQAMFSNTGNTGTASMTTAPEEMLTVGLEM